jgi:tripeptide aminopeptidase
MLPPASVSRTGEYADRGDYHRELSPDWEFYPTYLAKLERVRAFLDALPADALSPETTDDRDGFVHPYAMSAGVDRTSVRFIVRDFETKGLKAKENLLTSLADTTVARFRGARVEVSIEEQYRNMREILDRNPAVVDHAREAIRRAGLTVRERPIRGGTDGSRLSFMGLPTPNLFAGEHNFHSRLEWVSVQDMEKAVEVIVHLARVWEERGV